MLKILKGHYLLDANIHFAWTWRKLLGCICSHISIVRRDCHARGQHVLDGQKGTSILTISRTEWNEPFMFHFGFNALFPRN